MIFVFMNVHFIILHICICIYIEVSSVETDVPNKKVTIVSEGITDKNVFVEKLKSWSTASGKSVELADCCK
jgi:hypothetical protein